MKKVIVFIILLIIVFSITCPFMSYADPMSISQISSIAYAIGQASGITWGFSSATPEGVNTQMSTAINKWLDGRSIVVAFGAEMARVELGKLWVPAQLYNGIRNFLNDFIEEHSLETGEQVVFPGEINGTVLDNMYTNFGISDTGFSTTQTAAQRRLTIDTYYNSTNIGGLSSSHPSTYFDQCVGWTISYVSSNSINIVYLIQRTASEESSFYTHQYSKTVTLPEPSSRGTANIDEGYTPTVLNPDQEWTGRIDGYDDPDTNLDQLLGGIDEGISLDDLVIDDEIVDPVVPPTPVPTVEPGDIDGYWNRQAGQMEGLGNDIGDISGQLDDLGEQAGVISDAIEGVNEGIQSQTGVISGAVDQAAQDVADAIGEQTQTLNQSLTATAEGVQEIADALNPPEIDEKTFDLRELFPFCIPFDIYHLLQKFDASPTAPHVQLPIVIGSIGFSYNLDLDFSVWDPVAATMRTVELIVYALGLAWATSKVIKW